MYYRYHKIDDLLDISILQQSDNKWMKMSRLLMKDHVKYFSSIYQPYFIAKHLVHNKWRIKSVIFFSSFSFFSLFFNIS